jgi:hypothetical protein
MSFGSEEKHTGRNLIVTLRPKSWSRARSASLLACDSCAIGKAKTVFLGVGVGIGIGVALLKTDPDSDPDPES